MAKDNTKILPQITVMNAFLCLFVIMIHLTFAPLSELTVKSVPHIIIFVINKSLCFCVPAFIFLSGFKLFESYKDRPLAVKPFFKRRFKKIVIPYFIAVLIYIIYFGAKGWLEDGFFKTLFLGTVSAHFYYIVVLVQLYAMFPLVFRLFSRHSRTLLLVSAGITLFCVIFLNFGYWDRFFGTYIFYFVLGMFWAKYDLYRTLRKSLRKISVIYIVFCLIHMSKLYMSEFGGWGYRAFPVINMLYVLFAIIILYTASTEHLCRNHFITALSSLVGRYSYSIYLYHCLGIYILRYDILSKFSLSVKGSFFVTTFAIYSLIAVLCAYSYFSKGRQKL